jgi:hypothetical protein
LPVSLSLTESRHRSVFGGTSGEDPPPSPVGSCRLLPWLLGAQSRRKRIEGAAVSEPDELRLTIARHLGIAVDERTVVQDLAGT